MVMKREMMGKWQLEAMKPADAKFRNQQSRLPFSFILFFIIIFYAFNIVLDIFASTAVLVVASIAICTSMSCAMHEVRRCSYLCRVFLAYQSCSHVPLLARHTKGRKP